MYFKVTFNFTPRVTAETQKTWGESRNLTESHSKADEGSESVCGFFVKSWWETTRHVVVLVEEKLDSRLKPNVLMDNIFVKQLIWVDMVNCAWNQLLYELFLIVPTAGFCFNSTTTQK